MGYAINGDLLISSQVAKILRVSRQRIQQMVVNKILSPLYVFNKTSSRKLYLFDKNMVKEYSKKRVVNWKEPLESSLLSIPDIVDLLKCPKSWVYDMSRRGRLVPDLVAGENGGNFLCLYERDKILGIWNKRNTNKGYRENTIILIKKIIKLNEKGLSDSEIARKLGCKQPQITRLRKEAGLSSEYGRGRPGKNRDIN